MSLVGKDMIDFSAGVPSPKAIKDSGNVGVVRYVSPAREPWMRGKPLTRTEADALKDAGLVIVSNWQMRKGGNDTSDWRRGAAGADEDYPIAQSIHEEAGGHPDGVIYVSIDANPTRTMYEDMVRPYLVRWQEHIGRERLGVYCNARVLDWCLKDGLGQWFWQHNWSGDTTLNNDHPAAHIHQYAIDSGKVGGVGVDDNRILKEKFGQWGTEEAATQPERPTMPATERGPWTGDPTWLPDVLRLWGLQVTDVDDPLHDGHDDMREIRGVIGHHTAGGGVNDWRIVKYGRPGLDGPLAQLVLEKDGTIKFIAGGVCWHAGSGGWGDFGPDANYYTIGIEAVSKGTPPWDWTEVQLQNYKIAVAAILWRVGRDANSFCGHREYNTRDGKIDPAGIDLDRFRREVQALIDRGPYVAPAGPGAIEQLRGENTWLGDRLHTEVERVCPDGRGRYAHYQTGSIYWHPDTGAHAVPKQIFEFWASVGWETSFLGYPVAAAVRVDKTGVHQAFQGGLIMRKDLERGWPLIGGIRDTWAGLGGLSGLGWPLSREIEFNGGKGVYQQFDNGTVAWRHDLGAVPFVNGKIPEKW